MATTYTLISSQTLSGSAASVTFSSIPSTYTDLVLQVSARADNAATYSALNFQFNGNTGSIYSVTYLIGDGATASSGRTTWTQMAPYRPIAGANATASTFGSVEIYIPNYLASAYKPVSVFGTGENNATTSNMTATAGLFSDTTAISSIVLSPTSNFVSGSTFYLYGIKNA